MLVEIISTSSQHKETHTSSYSDIVSFMMHTLIDTVVFGKNLGFSGDQITVYWEILVGVKFGELLNFGDWQILIWRISSHVPLSMRIMAQNG